MVKNRCETHIAEIKITLKNIKPAIWCRIDDDFGHEMADESRVKLDQVAEPKSRFIYEYDFDMTLGTIGSTRSGWKK